jgi:hypothetical protein
MTRRTDPIFEVFDANDAFRSTPTEEEMQQVWDLIGPLMERYLRLRPIWQVAAGASIEGFETGMLKRIMWYGEGPFPQDSIEDHQDPPPSKRPMVIGTTPIHDYPRLPKELLTEEEQPITCRSGCRHCASGAAAITRRKRFLTLKLVGPSAIARPI